MASLSASRIGNTLSLTLNLTTRTRTFDFSVTTIERQRRRHHHTSGRRHHIYRDHRFSQLSRSFSTDSTLRQTTTPSSTTTARPAAPPPPSARPTTSTPYQSKASSAPTAPTLRATTANPPQPPIADITTTGFSDTPPTTQNTSPQTDWTRSFSGLSSAPFPKETCDILLAPLDADDVEIKPDGIVYLPEIKYRRILNRAFGPGGWGLAPRGETIVTEKAVTREYALVVDGRLISIARGEQDYHDPSSIPTATEGCKSNALMRCCKDLGVASELWDPRFIRKHLKENSKETWVEHVVSKKRKKIWMRKDDEARYPFKEVKMGGASGAF